MSISVSSISGVPAGRRGGGGSHKNINMRILHMHIYIHTHYMLGGEKEAAAVLI